MVDIQANTVHIQANTFKIFHKEKYLSLEKVIPMAKFANHYKTIF